MMIIKLSFQIAFLFYMYIIPNICSYIKNNFYIMDTKCYNYSDYIIRERLDEIREVR